MKTYRYVILGGGVVAGYAAQAFAEQGLKAGDLAIVSADDTLPYDRPPLSKDFLKGEKQESDTLINDEAFYNKHGINVFLNTTVQRLDTTDKVLETSNGRIGYEKLLLATGSKVNKLDVPGADLDGILYLRFLNDSKRIKQWMEKTKRAVVIGGGYIGMEVTSVLAQKNIEVTMVFPDERLMKRFFTPEMSAFFEGYYKKKGVKIITGDKAVSFTGEGNISGVKLESGEELPADMVVVGVGVKPLIELVKDTNIKVEEDAVSVNAYLRTSVSDIFAAGDIAYYEDVLFKKKRRVEHWDNAKQQGEYAARRMMEEEVEPFMKAPYFFSDIFDLSYEFWGETEKADDVIYRGEVDSGKFSAWWLRDGKVIGAFVMDRPKEEAKIAQEWVENGQRVSPDVLRDESQPLKEKTQEAV